MPAPNRSLNTAPSSPLAKARDKWMADQGHQLCDVHSLKAPPEMAQYLRNRIEAAFLAGVAAARYIPAKDR